MSNAVNSVGATLRLGANLVAEIKKISGVSMSAETIDVTTLGSTGGYREFISSFIDPGEVQLEGHFYPGDTLGQIAMKTAFDAKTLSSYTITFPASMGATWTFDGLVNKFETSAGVGDAVAFNATIKVSGQPTLGVTASTGASAFVITQAGGTGLTGATWTPAFATATTKYGFSFNTQTAFVVKVTAASHTIKLYVDDVYVQDLTSGSESASIALATAISKKVTVKCYEASKNPVYYDVMVSKTS